MRQPDLNNDAGTIRAWRLPKPPAGVGIPDWQAGLVTWYVEADPGVLDPFGFTAWYLGVVTLRDVPGVPPAKRHYPEAEYEILWFSIDPTKRVTVETFDRRLDGDLESGPTGIFVQPHDMVYQWHGTTDEQATDLGEQVVRTILDGVSPSRPPFEMDPLGASAFSEAWRRRLRATVEHYRTGHWPAIEARA